MADLNTPSTTYDDRNLPISNGLSDLLQKTGKIQNENLGQQVMSNNQVNNLIDVTKLNLPAVNGYSFNGYANLNPQEQSFLNAQSSNQANQFNTLQNQVLLANVKGNQLAGQQVQNLKTNTGQFFDNSGINQNNSSLGLSLLNNANNIGNEQVRNNNQELANQLSQGLNQFQQTQTQLQGQAVQQADANKKYERQIMENDRGFARNILESDRTYNTNTSGNIQVIDDKGNLTVMKDSKGMPVATYQKATAERAYQNDRDKYYTDMFGLLYNKNQPVVGKDGKPLFTQQGLSNRNALEAGTLGNLKESMNINKIAALQDSDIITNLVTNTLAQQKAANETQEYKNRLSGTSGTAGNTTSGFKSPTINDPSFSPQDVDKVAQFNLTNEDRNLLRFRDVNNNELADKDTVKQSAAYKNAIAKDASMKATFGEGYGTVFDIQVNPAPLNDLSKKTTYKVVPVPPGQAVVFSPYTFANPAFDDPENVKNYNLAKESYVANLTNTILGNSKGNISQLYIKSQLGDLSPSSPTPTIVGLTGKSGNPYDPSSNTNFAELNMARLSPEEIGQFQNEYYKIANTASSKQNTTEQVYNGLINEWNTKFPAEVDANGKVTKAAFATKKTAAEVIGLMDTPNYIGVGTSGVGDLNARDAITGIIAAQYKGPVKELLGSKDDKKAVTFDLLRDQVGNLTRFVQGDTNPGNELGAGLFDLFVSVPKIGYTEFKGIDPSDTAKMVDVYNGLQPNRKTEFRDSLKGLFQGNIPTNTADPDSKPFAQKLKALTNLGFILDDKDRIKSADTSNSRYQAMNLMFNYGQKITDSGSSDDRMARLYQIQAILQTAGANKGVAGMLADIFTPLPIKK
jgi:hypothetical protein